MKRAARPDIASIQRLAVRIFGPARPLTTAQVTAGVSTFVYRVERGGETFYLRVLPEVGASFAPEARAHALLREHGVRVPAVLYCEHRDNELGLSVMATTEIAGHSVASCGLTERTEAILRAAGGDLARIHSVPVEGFGWIARERQDAATLAAEWPTDRAFLTQYLASDLALLRDNHLDASDSAAIEAIVAQRDAWLDAEQAWLAHGDLDLTHIYQHGDEYNGIIDFGEIRGTDRWYDLGHFRLHDGEQIARPVLPWLLAGYRAVAPLPDEAEQRIAFASLLIGIRTLARVSARHPGGPFVAHGLRAIGRDVAFLLRG